MSWRKSIEEWRALTPEQQREIRHRRLPGKVARSMAFEGEPVDQKMLEEMLVCLTESRAKSRANPEECCFGKARSDTSIETPRHHATFAPSRKV